MRCLNVSFILLFTVMFEIAVHFYYDFMTFLSIYCIIIYNYYYCYLLANNKSV